MALKSDIPYSSAIIKRRRIETQSSTFNSSNSSSNRNFYGVSISHDFACFRKTASHRSKPQDKEAWFVIDRYKKLQCSWQLKRLMLHRDGKDFKQPVDRNSLDSEVPESNPMEIIKSKLEKGFYYGTDEFAADIRLMFSNIIFYYSPRNEMHRRAKRLRELFEKNWKSINERWESETPKDIDSRMQKIRKKRRTKRKPCRKVPNFRIEGQKQVDEKKTESFLDTLLASQQVLLNLQSTLQS